MNRALPISALAVLLSSGLFLNPLSGQAAEPATESVQDDSNAATLAYLEQHLSQHPGDVRTQSKLANLRLRDAKATGNHLGLIQAERDFARLLEISPDSRNAHFGLAYARLGRHDFSGALEAARESARRNPDHFRVWALIGDVHMALGNYAEAEMAFRALHAKEMNLQSFARLGLIHQARGRLDEAQQAFENAIEAGKLLESSVEDLAWCHCMLADLALDRDEPELARKRFDQALKLDAASRFARYGLADLAREQGELERAEQLLHPLAAIDSPSYWVALGEVLLAQGKPEEAREWLAKAEADMWGDLDIQEYGHLRELAEYLIEHDGDPEKAVELARMDLEQVRHDSATYETLAWAQHYAGQHQAAVRSIREALRSGSHRPSLRKRAEDIFKAAGSMARPNRP